MPIGSTNISFSDLRTEYVGGNNNSVSFSQLYSGVISLDDFKDTARAFRKTYSSNATNQDASTVFGSDYAVDYPKQIIINNGVEIGATSTSNEALQIDAGNPNVFAGSISITNNGTITGAGGAAGANGGDAFEADVACTLVNNGTIRSGGGGGGSGGNGSVQSTASNTTLYVTLSISGECSATYGSNTGQSSSNTGGHCPNPYTSNIDGGTSGVFQYVNYQTAGQSETCTARCYRKRHITTTTSGGAGGVGAGYNQSAGPGSSGGTSAGAGGSGGAFGSAGSSGSNGTVSNGSSGGSAGKSIRGSSNVTLTNNGTITGPQSSN